MYLFVLVDAIVQWKINVSISVYLSSNAAIVSLKEKTLWASTTRQIKIK